jgi:topoisomerase IA-like protein
VRVWIDLHFSLTTLEIAYRENRFGPRIKKCGGHGSILSLTTLEIAYHENKFGPRIKKCGERGSIFNPTTLEIAYRENRFGPRIQKNVVSVDQTRDLQIFSLMLSQLSYHRVYES